MKAEKYIAVPVDAELLAAIENGCRESGLKIGPEAARRLRKSYRVGFFATKRKEVIHEDANC